MQVQYIYCKYFINRQSWSRKHRFLEMQLDLTVVYNTEFFSDIFPERNRHGWLTSNILLACLLALKLLALFFHSPLGEKKIQRVNSLPCQTGNPEQEKYDEVYSGQIDLSLHRLHGPLAAGNSGPISFWEAFVIQITVTSSLSAEVGTWPSPGQTGHLWPQ